MSEVPLWAYELVLKGSRGLHFLMGDVPLQSL